MSGWRERPPRPDDVTALTDLFQRAFGRPLSAAQYQWKLRGRSGPAEPVAMAVDVHDRPVCHVGAIPCRCRLGERERWVMVVVDVMTDPAWRRRGIMTRLASDLFTRWRDAGVALVLGLPNEAWRSRIDALKWQPLFPLRWLVRPILPERLLARRWGITAFNQASWMGNAWNWWWRRSPDPAVSVSRMVRADPEWDAFWTGTRLPGPGLARDAEWINWRYVNAPDQGYQVVVARRNGAVAGYAAARVQDGSALFGDVFTSPGDRPSFAALVNHIISGLAAEGVAVARALAVPGSWADEALRSLGFLPSRHAFGVHAVILDSTIPPSVLRAGAQWTMSGGDFDVV